MQELITRAELARRAGVDPKIVRRHLAPGKILEAAAVGKKIDASHPSAMEFVSSRVLRQSVDKAVGAAITHKPVTAPTSGSAKKRHDMKASDTPTFQSDMLDHIPEDIRKLSNKSLNQLVAIFGTDTRFVDWLKAKKLIQDIAEKEIKNAAALGELVNKELIKQGVLDPVDSMLRKLMTDGARTMAQRLEAKYKTGATVSEAEEFIQKQMTSFVKPMKATIARNFKKL